jgi:hypothetical protein
LYGLLASPFRAQGESVGSAGSEGCSASGKTVSPPHSGVDRYINTGQEGGERGGRLGRAGGACH